MEKMDLKQQLSFLYRVSRKEAVEVDVPRLRYLMIDGMGDPNASADYASAIQALYAVSYAAKFAMKRNNLGLDYVVMPLEGLWWADDWSVFAAADKSQWKWTMMILQPDFVPEDLIWRCMDEVRYRKGMDAVARLRLEGFYEGRCAQILHVGPFTEEGPTIQRLHAFIDGRSTKRGKHHEIYLSDTRRAAPQNWKTIIRQPMD